MYRNDNENPPSSAAACQEPCTAEAAAPNRRWRWSTTMCRPRRSPKSRTPRTFARSQRGPQPSPVSPPDPSRLTGSDRRRARGVRRTRSPTADARGELGRRRGRLVRLSLADGRPIHRVHRRCLCSRASTPRWPRRSPDTSRRSTSKTIPSFMPAMSSLASTTATTNSPSTSARDKVATQQAAVERIGRQIVAQQANVEQAKAQLAVRTSCAHANDIRIRSSAGAGSKGIRQPAGARKGTRRPRPSGRRRRKRPRRR